MSKFGENLVSDALVDAVKGITQRDSIDHNGKIIQLGDRVLVAEGYYRGRKGEVVALKATGAATIQLDKGSRIELRTENLDNFKGKQAEPFTADDANKARDKKKTKKEERDAEGDEDIEENLDNFKGKQAEPFTADDADKARGKKKKKTNEEDGEDCDDEDEVMVNPEMED